MILVSEKFEKNFFFIKNLDQNIYVIDDEQLVALSKQIAMIVKVKC